MTESLNQDVMIRAEGLSKRYRLGSGVAAGDQRTLREAITAGGTKLAGTLTRRGTHSANTDPPGSFWALQDVSFEVGRGEVVGVIGRNGAGKSTLLKVLSRITDPTRGRGLIRGRVGSLLEVGTGFHPELSGRENIYLNGAILGMTRKEIRARFSEIVEFSGVERFLDTPVKRYSSGMYVRLAFSVAAHLEPEVLLVDEVLAVGDAEFQRRCLGRMREVSGRGGRTVIFVSHNMDSVLSLCSRVLVLEGGRTDGCVPAEEGVRRYLAGAEHDSAVALIDRPRTVLTGDGPRFANLTITGDGATPGVARCGEAIRFDVELVRISGLEHGECGIVITNEQGQRVAMLHSEYHAGLTISGRTTARVQCTVPNLALVPGRYHVDLGLGNHNRMIEYVERAGRFDVMFGDVFGTGKLPDSRQGHVLMPSEWGIAA